MSEAILQLDLEEKRRLLSRLLRARRPGAERRLPLSFAQHRLWFLDQLEPASPAYIIAGGIRVRGPLRSAALRRSLDAVVARHETLRTAIETTAGEPCQVVLPTAPLPLAIVDLGTLPTAVREGELDRLATALARQPFDLARAPLWRVCLVRQGQGDQALLFTLHHIIGDGVSMEILSREVMAFYRTFVTGVAPLLPDLPLQYGDFAVAERRALSPGGGRREAALRFWNQRLAGAPPLFDLRASRRRPDEASHRGNRQVRLLAPEVRSGLEALSRREGVTLFATLLAAFQVVLSEHSGADDFVLGVPIDGRDRQELFGIVGCLLNLLPIRADLRGDPSFQSLLQRVREGLVEAQSYQDLPFELLVDELKLRRDLGYSPLVQVTCSLQHSPPAVAPPGIELAPLAGGGAAIESDLAQFDLSLSARAGARLLALTLTYKLDLYDDELAAGLLESLVVLLDAAARQPESRLSALREVLAAAAKERQERRIDELRQVRLRKLESLQPRAGGGRGARRPERDRAREGGEP